jgi:uncharacterized membrane protein YeaQ/YmgE (transglycosylase-associated protein family)
MSLTGLVILLVIAGICGSVGSGIAGHKNTGCLGSIALGFVGAFLGAWLARALHLPEVFSVHFGRESFPIVWSIVGSAIFVGVLSFLTRPRGYF